MTDLQPPGAAHRHRRLPVSWATVGLLAVVLAYADGFWLTSLRGAVGAIEHTQTPVRDWARGSALMVPVYVAGIVAALWLTHRWVPRRHTLARVLMTAGLVVIAATGIAVAHAGVTAAQDYASQSRQLTTLHSTHLPTTPAVGTVDPDGCSSLCAAQKLTVAAHVKGIGLAAGVLLLTNVVLLGWVVALRGGRLWTAPPTADTVDAEPPLATAAAGALV